MKIGELARAAGVPVDTVRFYERNGLLAPPARRASGYREYSDDALRTLGFIQEAKRVGLSLSEIRSLLELEAEHAQGRVPDAIDMRYALSNLEQRIAQLTRLRDAVRTLQTPTPLDRASTPVRDALRTASTASPPIDPEVP